MNAFFQKKVVPHFAAIAVFLLVSVLFCIPALQGMVLDQHDTAGWRGMAQQSFEFRDQYGHFPLWSNSMFGGMPAYTFAMEGPVLHIGYIQEILMLGLPVPVGYFFLACVCFYILSMSLGIRPIIAVLASIAYAYSTYNPIILSVGHNTKMLAISYAPAVIGGAILLFNRKYWAGAITTILAFGLMVASQHLQIVYYTLITLGILCLVFIIWSIKAKSSAALVKPLIVLVASTLIGFANYAVSMLPLQEYAKETMRGGASELTKPNSATRTKGGLDKDYAFLYGSYGIGESFTVMVPRLYGGSVPTVVNNELKSEFGENTKTAEKLSELTGMGEDQANQFVKQLPAYWGNQPSHAGPVYLGAIIVFLFIFGCFYVDSWHKWWIIIASAVAFVLSWGKNLEAVNYFLFDSLPFYNKFRAPAMSLVIPQLAFPTLAALALERLASGKDEYKHVLAIFKKSLIATGIIAAGMLFFYISSDFSNETDKGLKQNLSGMMLQQAGANASPQVQQQAESFGSSIVKALQDDRRSLFGSDLFRSLLLIALGAGLIWFFLKQKLKLNIVLPALLLLSSFDILSVGRRYLNSNNFIEKSDFETQPTQADLQIKQDNNPPFRVFDQADQQGPFNSSRASFFHNSVGGYSPAKLELYQDFIEFQLSKGNMQAFNMMNTRYFIVSNPSNNQPVAQLNPEAFGPCWLARSIKYVPNADAEMAALDSMPLKEVAIVQEKFKAIAGDQPVYDSTATITWLENKNDLIRYKTNAVTPQFAVFSEVYYKQGWNAYINGSKADFCKVNYILRGMKIPAGQNEIEFRFEPQSYKTGSMITMGAAAVTYLLILLAAFVGWKNYSRLKNKV